MSSPVLCPDHAGLTNDPGHFLNLIDRNCVPYTWMELFLFAGGCLLWVAAYAVLIRNSLRYRYMEMAAVAVCSNFAWEFTWSWPFKTDMGWFLVWTYRAWFFLDIFIFWQLLRWGSKQISQPAFRDRFKAAAIFITLGFTALYYFFVREGMDTPIGANSAYLAQIIVSSTCLLLLLGTPDLEGFSASVAWLKCVGTGMNTVMMMMHYPRNHFLHTLGILAFIMDATYIGYFLRMKAKEAAIAPDTA
jgi:hypothetical protein